MKLSAEERAAIDAPAERDGMPVTRWAREGLLALARRNQAAV